MVAAALRTWVVPAVTGIVAAALWLLGTAEVVSAPLAVSGVATSLLLLVSFTAFRDHFLSEAPAERWTSLGFSIVWLAVLLATVYAHDFPGPPLQRGTLRAAGAALSLPPARHYSIVAEGHFKTAESRSNRFAEYRLEVTPQDGEARRLIGRFEVTSTRQRLGRRGSTTVQVERTSFVHRVDLPGDRPASLRLVDVDGSLEPEVAVEVYRGASRWWLPAAGLAGILFALVWEKRQKGTGTVLLVTSVTFFVAFAYVTWGSPHPELRSLVGAVLVGGIIGTPLAMILWRVVPARWAAVR